MDRAKDDVGTVRTSVHDAVATIVISNPARRNALSASMMADLGRTLRLVEADPEVVAVVVCGAGDTFVAGADIAGLGPTASSAGVEDRIEQAADEMLRGLEQLSKPSVAMIRGYCFGPAWPWRSVRTSDWLRLAATSPSRRHGSGLRIRYSQCRHW